MPPAFRVGRVTFLVSLAGCLRGHLALFCDKSVSVARLVLVRDVNEAGRRISPDMVSLPNSALNYSMIGRHRSALRDTRGAEEFVGLFKVSLS
jgi:hypothetical protein